MRKFAKSKLFSTFCEKRQKSYDFFRSLYLIDKLTKWCRHSPLMKAQLQVSFTTRPKILSSPPLTIPPPEFGPLKVKNFFKIFGKFSVLGGAATKLDTHKAAVTGLSLHVTGQFLLSASRDKSWAFSDIKSGNFDAL